MLSCEQKLIFILNYIKKFGKLVMDDTTCPELVDIIHINHALFNTQRKGLFTKRDQVTLNSHGRKYLSSWESSHVSDSFLINTTNSPGFYKTITQYYIYDLIYNLDYERDYVNETVAGHLDELHDHIVMGKPIVHFRTNIISLEYV